jgi:nitrogen fixation-related uncharacterized protein
MPVWGWVVIAVAVVILAAAIGWALWSRRRTGQLQEHFGPEYERVLADSDSRLEAESELSEREQRREELDIRPLPSAARRRYLSDWQGTQSRFVDAPEEAVRDADRLVTEVMRARGYPMRDFDRRAADISVDHPHVVQNYRSAHAISATIEEGSASTEDLRKAMVNYRALFEELLAEDQRGDVREVG